MNTPKQHLESKGYETPEDNYFAFDLTYKDIYSLMHSYALYVSKYGTDRNEILNLLQGLENLKSFNENIINEFCPNRKKETE